MKNKIALLIILFSLPIIAQSENGFQIARVKYSGGGDWYNDKSAEVNLLRFIGENTNIIVNPKYIFVEVGSQEIFSFPFLFITGHGNILFSESEAENLRNYLLNGGFLYVDDDYGLDKAFRREIKKVFPDKELIELPFDYGLYHSVYHFDSLPPKTHEHDNKPSQGFGIFSEGRLILYYTYESNPSDGWADADIHGDSADKRKEALKFGTNIVIWALIN